MLILENCFKDIVAFENLWRAWILYCRGKRERAAVREFERRLENNLGRLLSDLKNETYRHGGYYQFIINDPKRRIISSPAVRDHLVHRMVYNILEPFYERIFSPFSFSCRQGRGTHSAVKFL